MPVDELFVIAAGIASVGYLLWYMFKGRKIAKRFEDEHRGR